MCAQISKSKGSGCLSPLNIEPLSMQPVSGKVTCISTSAMISQSTTGLLVWQWVAGLAKWTGWVHTRQYTYIFWIAQISLLSLFPTEEHNFCIFPRSRNRPESLPCYLYIRAYPGTAHTSREQRTASCSCYIATIYIYFSWMVDSLLLIKIPSVSQSVSFRFTLCFACSRPRLFKAM